MDFNTKMDHLFNDRFGLDDDEDAPQKQRAKQKIKRHRKGQQQTASTPTSSRNGSQKSSARLTSANDLDTPCKQIASLNLRQQQNSTANNSSSNSTGKPAKQKKTHKLLGSKSLTQLIPKGLFARKQSAEKKAAKNGAAKQQQAMNSHGSCRLATAQSFPNGAFYFDPMDSALAEPNNDSCDRVNSSSLIGLPQCRRLSAAGSLSSFGHNSSAAATRQLDEDNGYTSSLTSPAAHMGPIGGGGGQNGLMRKVVASTPALLAPFNRSKLSSNSGDSNGADQQADRKDEQQNSGKQKQPANNKYRKPFKNTALVLRDVKNSIGLVSSNGSSICFSGDLILFSGSFSRTYRRYLDLSGNLLT